jgi:hypothetical protein
LLNIYQIAKMVRKVNKSLQDWVSFVKKVQKEEGGSYTDAMKRAKVRKDKGEKWMTGGGVADSASSVSSAPAQAPAAPQAAAPAQAPAATQAAATGAPPGTPADSPAPPADLLANPKDISKEIVANPGGASSSTHTVVGARGGSKKQKTSKKQQKTSKKQKGGRRKTSCKK